MWNQVQVGMAEMLGLVSVLRPYVSLIRQAIGSRQDHREEKQDHREEHCGQSLGRTHGARVRH